MCASFGEPAFGRGSVLLTGVEGSTRLWRRELNAMCSAPAWHDTIVAPLVRQNRGTIVKSRSRACSSDQPGVA